MSMYFHFHPDTQNLGANLNAILDLLMIKSFYNYSHADTNQLLQSPQQSKVQITNKATEPPSVAEQSEADNTAT